jgi:CRP/FNR family transcriptional regulator, dissimilatory nitrate respiration regulator
MIDQGMRTREHAMDSVSSLGIPLLAGLNSVDRSEVDHRLAERARTVDRNQAISLRGDPMTSLLILVKGRAHAEIVTGDGHALVVENFLGPETIALAMLFCPDPHYPVSVIADSVCRITYLERELLLDLCQRSRAVLEQVLSDSGRRVSFLAGRLRMSQFASLRQKIAVYLADLRHRTDRESTTYVFIPHSRQELADLFGVARPSLSRELSRLCDEGILCAHGSRIEIRDPGTLASLVSGCE